MKLKINRLKYFGRFYETCSGFRFYVTFNVLICIINNGRGPPDQRLFKIKAYKLDKAIRIEESGALRSGVWFRANNLMIMMTQHNFCLLFNLKRYFSLFINVIETILSIFCEF